MFICFSFSHVYTFINVLAFQVLFQNDSLATLLARVVGIIGPIDPDMILKGREAHKYFTKNFMLYDRNQVLQNIVIFHRISLFLS